MERTYRVVLGIVENEYVITTHEKFLPLTSLRWTGKGSCVIDAIRDAFEAFWFFGDQANIDDRNFGKGE